MAGGSYGSSGTVPATSGSPAAPSNAATMGPPGQAPTMGAPSNAATLGTSHPAPSTWPTGGASGPEATPHGYGPATPSLAVGTIVAGSFRIDGHLGAGGMGVVYRATHVELERTIALKVHRGGGTADAARLSREAKAMARLNHPNVIGVHDVRTDGDQVVIAMELVDGGTLRDAVVGRPWAEIVGLYRQAARGLAAAHAVGLVHRDFKPENVLVGTDGRVRVADFGLARAAGSAVGGADVDTLSSSLDRLTKTGAVVGTPRYMAPEQFGGTEVDARADQFSFCVALYEALWGQLPFTAQTAGELLYAMTTRGPNPPPASAVPPRTADAIVRGLAADPTQRFADMRQLSAALDPTGRADSNAAGAGLVIGLVAAVVALGGGAGFVLLRDAPADADPAAVAMPQAPAPQVDVVEDPAATLEPETALTPTPQPSIAPQVDPPVPIAPPPVPDGDPPVPAETPPPADKNAALGEIVDNNMFADPIGAIERVEKAEASGAGALSLGLALMQSAMPKDADALTPVEPVWPEGTTLVCGAGHNYVVRDVTRTVEEGPAIKVSTGCKIRIERATITADTIVAGGMAKSIELNDCTVTARQSVVDVQHTKATVRGLRMTEATEGAALKVNNTYLLVVDSEAKGDIGIHAAYAAKVDVESGTIEGTTASIRADPKANVTIADEVKLAGQTKQVAGGTIVRTVTKAPVSRP